MPEAVGRDSGYVDCSTTFSYDTNGAVEIIRAVFVRLTAIRRRGEVQSAILRHAAAHTRMCVENIDQLPEW